MGANIDGVGGSGTYTQTGGVANLRSWLRIGEGPSSTGVANISGGTLTVSQRTFIGEMGGGTLNLSGNAVMSSGNVELGMPVDNTSLPGSGVLNVTGNAVLNVQSEIGVGRGGGTGVMSIANSASVTASFNIDIGDSNNNSAGNSNFGTSSGTLIQTGGTLTTTSGAQIYVGQYDNAGESGRTGVNSGVYDLYGGVANLSNWLVVGNAGGMGVMNMSGSAILQTSSEVHIGDGVGGAATSAGTLNISGGVMAVNNWFVVGRNGGNGVLNMTGGSIMQLTPGNNNFQNLDVAAGNGAQGTFNQNGGTVNVYGQLLVPETGNTATNGTYNLSGSGVVISNNWFAVGRNGGTGYFNLSGGTLVHTNNNQMTIGSSGLGTFTMTGGLLVDSAPSTWVGESNNGTLSISAGAAHVNQIEMGVNGSGNGTVALSGGLLSATQIYQGSVGSTATLRLAGGTLQAAAGASLNFISGLTAAYVDSGMTTIDTNSQNVTVTQPLLAGTGSGGLQKAGAGMLTLSGLAGQSTYTGPTVISAGTLQLGGGGVINVTHQWSFDTNGYTDSVGGVTAIPSGNASLGAGGVTITGNGTSHVNYVSLGNGSSNVLPTTNAPYTIQVWATDNQYQAWSRIFDFGSTAGGNSNLLWSWTEGTNPPGLVAPGPTSAGTYAFGTGSEYNVSLVVYPNGPGSMVQWYAMDTSGDLLGSGSLATSWNISQLTQANMWLGRSEYGDNDANATYQNVTIYNGALTQSQVVALNVAGPDAPLTSLVPILTTAAAPALPSTTPVTVARNATFDLNGGTQQIASLNDATPGNGGTVINSSTSSVAVLTLSPTGSATFSGTIAEDTLGTSLVLDGPGTQVLSGTNTYQGGTTVLEGTLILADNEAIAAGTSLIVGDPSLLSADLVPSSVGVLASGLQTEVGQVSAGAFNRAGTRYVRIVRRGHLRDGPCRAP